MSNSKLRNVGRSAVRAIYLALLLSTFGAIPIGTSILTLPRRKEEKALESPCEAVPTSAFTSTPSAPVRGSHGSKRGSRSSREFSLRENSPKARRRTPRPSGRGIGEPRARARFASRPAAPLSVAIALFISALSACISSSGTGGASPAPGTLDREQVLAVAAKAPEAAEFFKANPGAVAEVKRLDNLTDLAAKYPVIYGGLSGEAWQVDYRAGDAALLCAVQAKPETVRCFRIVAVNLR